MSTRGDQDPTKESRDNPVTLEGEWVQEATEGGRVGLESGLDGACVTPAVHPREVENVGPERNPAQEGYTGESADAEEDSDIEPVEEEEEGEEEEENTVSDQGMVDAHRFPMAGFRFMFLDLIHAILNRVYYNDHVLRRPCENPVAETPGPSTSGHSSVMQIPPGPPPSTVRAAEYDNQPSGPILSLPEVISTFPELEEPTDFEETTHHYLREPDLCTQEPAVRAAAVEGVGQAIEEVEEQATAEEPEKEFMKQSMALEGEYHYDAWNEVDNIFDEEEEKEGEEKKNQEALNEMDPDPADHNTRKSS
ncbi:cancer/testis antigen 47A-like [Mesocricetus auratus]|uniref:Cancer/testis antigen 47A-like n=1 Tax=Mesocricetus auratus TaxID=10036 RepID=A0ABM2XAE9_MESAU|nr:cancer/testis antigen 47A-like [Mesocricetus auratus]